MRQALREGLRRFGVDDPVLARAANQHRRRDRFGIAGRRHLLHRAIGRFEPAPARPGQPDIGMTCEEILRALEAYFVRCHELVSECHFQRVARLHAPHPVGAVAKQVLQMAGGPGDEGRVAARLYADHRRREHRGGELFRPRMQPAQEDVPAHGMGQRDRRALAHRPHDLVHETGEILVIFAEIADMRLQSVGQGAV